MASQDAAPAHSGSMLEEMTPLAVWCWILLFDGLCWVGIIAGFRALLRWLV